MSKMILRAARINAGFTLEQVSKQVGVSVPTLSKWENYITFPTAMQLQKLCGLYGCTLNDIFVPDKLANS